MSKSKNLVAMAFDTGGTMSDTFIIDEEGVFVVGKRRLLQRMNLRVF